MKILCENLPARTFVFYLALMFLRKAWNICSRYQLWENRTDCVLALVKQPDYENSKFKPTVITVIKSCHQHGYPWPSLATSPYHSSPPAGLQGYILCPHIVAVCKFELVVLLLHGHMWGSIGVHHLWARPCFSSSVPRVWFVLLAQFSWWGQVSV